MVVIIIMLIFVGAAVCLITSLYIKSYRKELDELHGKCVVLKDRQGDIEELRKKVDLLTYQVDESLKQVHEMQENLERRNYRKRYKNNDNVENDRYSGCVDDISPRGVSGC